MWLCADCVQTFVSILKWSVCLFLCASPGRVFGTKTWSGWFDGKPLDGVNNETLDKVREILDYGCDQIDDVQCRAKSPSQTIPNNTTTTWQDGSYQRFACNSTSNQCAIRSQTFWNYETDCSDFEIRFLCQVSADSTQTEPASDNLSANGGFIAMAAGLSVVVPLIFVLVMQLRRAKREERERERRRPEAGREENGARDSPPSYEQVFGSNYLPASTVHSRNSSMDTLLHENETSQRGTGGTSVDNAAYVAILGLSAVPGNANDRSQVSLQRPRSNLTSLERGVATISGSFVADIPVSLITTQTTVPRETVSSNIGNLWPSTSQVMTNASLPNSSNPSSSLLSSSPPSTSSSISPPPQQPPSPPPPSSSWSVQNSNTTSESSRFQETLQRFPGMHISIEDFFASLRVLHQDSESVGPPPSYDEALKILESAAMAKERKSIIK